MFSKINRVKIKGGDCIPFFLGWEKKLNFYHDPLDSF